MPTAISYEKTIALTNTAPNTLTIPTVILPAALVCDVPVAEAVVVGEMDCTFHVMWPGPWVGKATKVVGVLGLLGALTMTSGPE